MNGLDPQRNHIRFIAACITVLGITCAVCGTILVYKGYSGELLIGGVVAAISGLCGFLGAGRPNQSSPDVTVSTSPQKVEVKQPIETPKP